MFSKKNGKFQASPAPGALCFPDHSRLKLGQRRNLDRINRINRIRVVDKISVDSDLQGIFPIL